MGIDFTPDPQLYPFESRWFDVAWTHPLRRRGARVRRSCCVTATRRGFPVSGHHRRTAGPFPLIMAPDYLGFGLSERPSGFEQVDEHARVIGMGRLDRYLSMGQDWGGPISMAVAVERADQGPRHPCWATALAGETRWR